jgi:hypothetical protein
MVEASSFTVHPQQFSMIYAQTLSPISMPSSYLLTIASSFFLPNLKEDSLVMGLWTWSLKKKEIFVGEDGEEGKKKEKEVIGWLKVGVSCHFSSGGGDLIRIGVYSELLVYYTMGNLVTSIFFFF